MSKKHLFTYIEEKDLEGLYNEFFKGKTGSADNEEIPDYCLNVYKWMLVAQDYGLKDAQKILDDLNEAFLDRCGSEAIGDLSAEVAFYHFLGLQGVPKNEKKGFARLKRTLEDIGVFDQFSIADEVKKNKDKLSAKIIKEVEKIMAEFADPVPKAVSVSPFKKSEFDFTTFYLRNHQNWLLFRPTISLIFFIEENLKITCEAVADLIEFYVASIPEGSLRCYSNSSGHYMPVKKAQITKDLKKLRNLPADYVGFHLDYIGEEGFVGPYGVLFSAHTSSVQLDKVHYLKIDFPENILDIWGEKKFLEFAINAGGLLPLAYGYISYALNHTYSECPDVIEPLLSKYIGFDSADSIIGTRMKGKCLNGHWIDLLGMKLTQSLGGFDQIKSSLPEVEVQKLKNNVTFIRSSRLPPIGDVSQGLKDIGCLPKVSQFLKPLRCPNPRTSFEQINMSDWLGRFDQLPKKNWDNSD